MLLEIIEEEASQYRRIVSEGAGPFVIRIVSRYLLAVLTDCPIYWRTAWLVCKSYRAILFVLALGDLRATC